MHSIFAFTESLEYYIVEEELQHSWGWDGFFIDRMESKTMWAQTTQIVNELRSVPWRWGKRLASGLLVKHLAAMEMRV